MSKPIVEYSEATVEVGKRGSVYITTPHPVLGEIYGPKWVHTSRVLLIDERGFETLNTRYNKRTE